MRNQLPPPSLQNDLSHVSRAFLISLYILRHHFTLPEKISTSKPTEPPPHLSPPASERRPTEAAKRPRRRTAHRSPLPGRQRLLRRASGRRDLEREARGGPMGAPSRPLGPWLVGVCDRRIAVAQRCGETKNKVCWIIGSFVTLFRCIDA